jgi:gamma-glutamylcyclotransferase (GGCT)/AIG2-like uncharacterized protein YtfP
MDPSDSLLFVYGTLRDPDLLAGVLARPLNAPTMLAATAPGYRAVHYPGRIYPALVHAPGAAAEGLVLTDLSGFEHDLLDAFEGDEYARALIAVMIGEELHEVFAYLPVVSVAPNAEGWTLSIWQSLHKPQVLAGEHSSARQLREKLIAVRPN